MPTATFRNGNDTIFTSTSEKKKANPIRNTNVKFYLMNADTAWP